MRETSGLNGKKPEKNLSPVKKSEELKSEELKKKQDDFKIEWDEESKQDNNDLN